MEFLKDQALEQRGKGNPGPRAVPYEVPKAHLPVGAAFRLQNPAWGGTISFKELPALGNLISIEGLSPS